MPFCGRVSGSGVHRASFTDRAILGDPRTDHKSITSPVTGPPRQLVVSATTAIFRCWALISIWWWPIVCVCVCVYAARVIRMILLSAWIIHDWSGGACWLILGGCVWQMVVYGRLRRVAPPLLGSGRVAGLKPLYIAAGKWDYPCVLIQDLPYRYCWRRMLARRGYTVMMNDDKLPKIHITGYWVILKFAVHTYTRRRARTHAQCELLWFVVRVSSLRLYSITIK